MTAGPTFWLGCADHDWQGLTHGRTPRSLRKNQVLFHQDAPARTLFVIAQGRVRLVTHTFDGKERHIAVIGPQGLAGDCGMFGPGRHLTGALTSAETLLYEVPLADALDAMQSQRQVLLQVLAFADQRFRAMLYHHELLSAGAARKRVSLALLGLLHAHGEPHRDGHVIRILFTQEEMGSICSLSRVSVSTALGDLTRLGLIGRDKRQMLIRDVAGLRAVSLG